MGIRIIRKKTTFILAIIIGLAFLLAACGAGSQAHPENEDTGESTGSAPDGRSISGIVTVSGSTSVQPLAQDLADVFSDSYPGISVEIQGGGSSQGIKDAITGVSDIGNSSRDLKEEEKEGITEHIIAYDGIAVAVHPSNKISGLSKEQLTKIFKGEITNWKDVGGDDREILVVTREAGSGTRSAFQELLKLEEKKGDNTVSLIKNDALVADGNGPVKASIASKENAIGYLSLGIIDETVKKVSIEGVECTAENIKNKSYAISRPFLMLTGREPRPEVKAFLDFILGDEGQEVVSESYITIK